MSEVWRDQYEFSRELGRQEIIGRIRLLCLGKKVVGTRKLIEVLDGENGVKDKKDAVLQTLNRDAMAGELAEHWMRTQIQDSVNNTTYAYECACGRWSSGDAARDFNGHVVDAMLAVS